MATHYQRIQGVFKERVLPHFPSAERRFKNHFEASYDLIKNMGDAPDMNGDLTVLGVKPFSRGLSYGHLQKVSALITDAGLELAPVIFNRNHFSLDVSAKALSDTLGISLPEAMQKVKEAEACPPDVLEAWIYDPVQASEIISRNLNTNVPPEKVKNHLADFQFNHELLGYPQPLPDSLPFFLEDKKFLRISFFPRTPGSHSFSCVISNDGPIKPSLEPRASAAAIIGEIRESPLGIRSSAAIGSYSKYYEKCESGVIIKRTKQPGEWSVAHVSNLPEVFKHLPQFLLKRFS